MGRKKTQCRWLFWIPTFAAFRLHHAIPFGLVICKSEGGRGSGEARVGEGEHCARTSIRLQYAITFVRCSQVQLKTDGVAQVYTVESLQRQNTQIREYNSALEDQVQYLQM